jgi:hypothetical protein
VRLYAPLLEFNHHCGVVMQWAENTLDEARTLGSPLAARRGLPSGISTGRASIGMVRVVVI